MIQLSRRRLLAGVSATAAAAWLSSCSGRSAPNAGAIEQTLATHFGPETARSDPARRFAADLATYLASGVACINPWAACETDEGRIIQSFLESTTFLSSQATGSDFDYVTIFDPWTSPCASQLAQPI